LLINIQVIDFQSISIFSVHSSGYASQKVLHLETQALTSYFNIHY